jgi:hypothetical protein
MLDALKSFKGIDENKSMEKEIMEAIYQIEDINIGKAIIKNKSIKTIDNDCTISLDDMIHLIEMYLRLNTYTNLREENAHINLLSTSRHKINTRIKLRTSMMPDDEMERKRAHVANTMIQTLTFLLKYCSRHFLNKMYSEINKETNQRETAERFNEERL